MEKSIKCYVLYCTEDKTFLSSMSFWTDDVLQAVKYKDIKRAIEAQSHYDNTIKIMELSITIHGIILNHKK